MTDHPTGETQIVQLPDLGEGLVEARLDSYLVEVGQQVKRLEALAEVETAKATVELTSPWAGTVVELIAEADSWVNVGDPVLAIRVDP
jgi:pyruvate dehydrogenase E2 component (dihydrolipoamide acetyltransferase)